MSVESHGTRRCEVIAHRGGAAEVAENTWAAVAHTAGLGLRWMETDLRATADGVVVLSHDASLERTTGQARPIAEMTWAELSALDAGDGKAPARLDEVLEAYPQLSLNTDLKDASVIEPAAQVVARAGALDRVRFASFSRARLARLRELLPDARTSLGMRDVAALVGLSATGLGQRARTVIDRLTWGGKDVVARRPDAVQVPVRQYGVAVVTPRFVAAAHEAGLEVHVWTVDRSEQMRALAAMHVDALITDVPSLALEVLAG